MATREPQEEARRKSAPTSATSVELSTPPPPGPSAKRTELPSAPALDAWCPDEEAFAHEQLKKRGSLSMPVLARLINAEFKDKFYQHPIYGLVQRQKKTIRMVAEWHIKLETTIEGSPLWNSPAGGSGGGQLLPRSANEEPPADTPKTLTGSNPINIPSTLPDSKAHCSTTESTGSAINPLSRSDRNVHQTARVKKVTTDESLAGNRPSQEVGTARVGGGSAFKSAVYARDGDDWRQTILQALEYGQLERQNILLKAEGLMAGDLEPVAYKAMGLINNIPRGPPDGDLDGPNWLSPIDDYIDSSTLSSLSCYWELDDSVQEFYEDKWKDLPLVTRNSSLASYLLQILDPTNPLTKRVQLASNVLRLFVHDSKGSALPSSLRQFVVTNVRSPPDVVCDFALAQRALQNSMADREVLCSPTDVQQASIAEASVTTSPMLGRVTTSTATNTAAGSSVGISSVPTAEYARSCAEDAIQAVLILVDSVPLLEREAASFENRQHCKWTATNALVQLPTQAKRVKNGFSVRCRRCGYLSTETAPTYTSEENVYIVRERRCAACAEFGYQEPADGRQFAYNRDGHAYSREGCL